MDGGVKRACCFSLDGSRSFSLIVPNRGDLAGRLAATLKNSLKGRGSAAPAFDRPVRTCVLEGGWPQLYE